MTFEHNDLQFCVLHWSSHSLQNFKREEQNFVVMNEINNMSFLTADSKSKMSTVRPFEMQSIGIWLSYLTNDLLQYLIIMWSEYFFIEWIHISVLVYTRAARYIVCDSHLSGI